MPTLSSLPPLSRSFPHAYNLSNVRRSHVALVDDDDDFREATSLFLGGLGFDTTGFGRAQDLLEFLRDGRAADVIVVDWQLSEGIGIDLLPQLRESGILAPVIILTAMPAASHECEAFDRGAVDFLDKSRGAVGLAKRLAFITQQGQQFAERRDDEIVRDGPLTLRLKVDRAYWNGQDVGLTVTEFNIVKRLLENNGDYVTYRSIYDCVHFQGFVAGYGDDGFHSNVRTSIKRIRKKFKRIDPNFDKIENFLGFGYRWDTDSRAIGTASF